MKPRQILVVFLGLFFAAFAAPAADLPPLEKIEKDGWTIEFSLEDRALAEQLAGRVADFERIYGENAKSMIELEPAVIEARAGDFSRKLAELCALPDREEDFRKEIGRMRPTVVDLLAEFRAATSPRAVSVVRKAELIRRLQAGEKIPNHTYEAATNRVNFSFNFNFSFDRDYAITERPERLLVLPLNKRGDEAPTGDPVEALLKEMQETARALSNMGSQMYGKMVVAIGFNSVVANVLAKEIPPDSPAAWIQSGATQWALRRLFIHALNPELAESYLWYHEKQLQNAFRSTQRVALEEKSKELSALQQAAAYAVFRTIAEKHGNEAVSKLLAAFWKLKPAQRTSAAFGKICQKQLKQPLSAYLSRGVTIAPDVAKPAM